MNLDEINQGLVELVNGDDREFSNAAQFVQSVIQRAQSGQLSPSETAEVLNDVQRELSIIQDMNRLAIKEKLNTIINGLIVIAGAV
jgi:hypothetical protein